MSRFANLREECLGRLAEGVSGPAEKVLHFLIGVIGEAEKLESEADDSPECVSALDRTAHFIEGRLSGLGRRSGKSG